MSDIKKQQVSKLNLKPFLFFFCLSFLSQVLHAQERVTAKKSDTVNRHISVGLLYGYGYIFPSDKFVKGDNEKHRRINRYQTFSARVMFQNSGKEKNPWYQFYDNPYLGLGVCVSDFYDIREMGVPIAIYGFINGPFHRWNKLTFSYEIDLGMTGNWRHYNPVTNPYNIAIGATRTVYLHLGVGLAYRFSPNWETEFNVGVAHFSNGAIKVPNYGLNTLSPRIELRYKIHSESVLQKYKAPPFTRTNSLEFTTFISFKNSVLLDSVLVNTLEGYQGIYFPIYGFRATYNWQISRKSKFGVGLGFVYDSFKGSHIVVEDGKLLIEPLPMSYALRVSIYPSYELVIGPFSLLFQPALYVYRKRYLYELPAFYQRIGFKYTLAHHVTFGFNLRAYDFQISEFIEWSVGYQLNWPHK